MYICACMYVYIYIYTYYQQLLQYHVNLRYLHLKPVSHIHKSKARNSDVKLES